MTSLTPPMTLSATYHETHTPLKSSTPPQPYIASTGPTNTPIVTVNYGRSHEPQRHVGTDAYLKTSLSSSTSGGSAASDLKPIPPTHQYRFASLAESGLMNASRRPRSHDERSRSHHNTPSICDQLDMVENNSAVLQYLQQRELEGRDPEEEDHAIWILVSPHTSHMSQLTDLRTVLARMLRSYSQPVQLPVLDCDIDRYIGCITS